MIRNLEPSERRLPPHFGAERIARIVDRLDAATRPEHSNMPGSRFHSLKGDRVEPDAVAVSSNVRITFCFDGEAAIDVNMEDYH